MTRMRRCSLVVAVALAACVDSTSAPTAGGGVLSIHTLVTGSLALDSGQVVLTGPTNRTVKVTPGQTAVIDRLLPGTYAVVLRGFLGDGVDHYGATGVDVRAGENTSATVTFASFVPVVTALPPTLTSRSLTVAWSAVPGAVSYDVEAATDAAFTTNRVTMSASATSVDITTPTFGRYFVRVRAVDGLGVRGRSTTPQTIRLAQLDQSFEPGTFTLFAGGSTHKAQTFTVGVSGTLTQIDIYIQFASTDVFFDVRATGVGGVPLESDATTLYAETIPASRFGAAGYYSFVLGPNGIPVTNGQVLAFVMRPVTSTLSYQWNGRNDNSYTRGVWHFRNPSSGVTTWTVADPTFDLAFRTFVSP